MIKELIGAICTFFVMLPFLLINQKIFQVKKQNRFAFLFLIVNIVQLGALFILATSLYFVGQRTLLGMLIVFTVFLFLFLYFWITSQKPMVIPTAEKKEDYTDLFHTQPLGTFQEGQPSENPSSRGIIEEEKILEEDNFTRMVVEPDFEKFEKNNVRKTLEDIFKEN